ncbi:MAG: hypothetical protein NTZ05_01210, partial [Chloroflexi bacterium]|nr:hypothetical protein [Chloroflexota bacterium]
IDQPTYTQTILLGGNFDHFYIGPISPTPELDQNLTVYEKGSSKNTLGVDDPALDQKILAQRRELNPEKRKAIFMDIQRDLLKANYRWMMAGTIADTMFFPYLKDYRPAPAYSRGNLLRVWFDTEDPSYKGRQ